MMTLGEVFERCMPEPNTGCWLWTGATNSNGYGNVFRKGGTHLVHRLVCLETYGWAPVAMHTCDTPLCCNPDHIRPGTVLDNNRDRARKGRNGKPWGSNKLSLEQIAAIRASTKTNTELAKEYGLARTTIRRHRSA